MERAEGVERRHHGMIVSLFCAYVLHVGAGGLGGEGAEEGKGRRLSKHGTSVGSEDTVQAVEDPNQAVKAVPKASPHAAKEPPRATQACLT